MFCRQSTVPRCLKFMPISCMGPKHAPKDKDLIFLTNLYALEHVHVVRIWIMLINALKTQLMHKNFQTNPKKSHNTPVVLCWHEKKIESNKRQWISFRPQRWDVPHRKPSCLSSEAPVCEKHTPKSAQTGKNLYHGMLMPLMIACQFSWISDEFWIY